MLGCEGAPRGVRETWAKAVAKAARGKEKENDMNSRKRWECTELPGCTPAQGVIRTDSSDPIRVAMRDWDAYAPVLSLREAGANGPSGAPILLWWSHGCDPGAAGSACAAASLASRRTNAG